MNKHPYDVLDPPDQGHLIFTPCPGTKGVLETSVSELRQAGADAIVTMMTDEELAKFEVDSLPDVVRQSDMTWFHFPVETDWSGCDILFEAARPVTAEEVNGYFKAAAEGGSVAKSGHWCLNDPRSSIVDALSTMVIDGAQVKVYAWYDNEWGHVNRVMDIAVMIARSR